MDNVINSGGIKLYPEQIEYKLSSMIHMPFFVAGIPDDALGEKLALFVEQEEAFAFAKAEYDITDFEKYEIPKVVFSIPRFERTANGKLQRGQTVYKMIKS